MATRQELDERFKLITRRIPEQDIHGAEVIFAALAQGSKRPTCLWATSPTGKPHIGYLIPLLKFADFLRAGVEVIVLLLDVYSLLDNVKFPLDQVIQRMHYYHFTMEAALEAIGIPSSSVKFIRESSYQTNAKFVVDQWKLCTLVPQQAVRDSWDRSNDPDMLSPMLCPGLQSLAEEYLDVDFQFGGEDQRGIFTFAERFLPQLGYKKRGHLMNPMLPNLLGGKMSSSHPPDTKIMFLDEPETVHRKVKEAYSAVQDIPNNGVLATLRDVLIPFSQLQMERSQDESYLDSRGGVAQQEPFWTKSSPPGTVFTISSSTKDQGKNYCSFEEILQDLSDQKLSSDALTDAVSNALNQLLDPIRTAYRQSQAWQATESQAYPEQAS